MSETDLPIGQHEFDHLIERPTIPSLLRAKRFAWIPIRMLLSSAGIFSIFVAVIGLAFSSFYHSRAAFQQMGLSEARDQAEITFWIDFLSRISLYFALGAALLALAWIAQSRVKAIESAIASRTQAMVRSEREALQKLREVMTASEWEAHKLQLENARIPRSNQ